MIQLSKPHPVKDYIKIQLCRVQLWRTPFCVDTALETCKKLAAGASVGRYGDGEFDVLLQKDGRPFQPPDPQLGERLAQVLSLTREEAPGFEVALPRMMATFRGYTHGQQYFWTKVNREDGPKIIPLLRRDRFLDAQFARVHIIKQSKARQRQHLAAIQSIWQDKDITVIESDSVKLGVGESLLDNARSVERIIAPSCNAFAWYDDILAAAKTVKKDRLLLIVLGMAATVLAYDLYQEGYHAVDFGQGLFDWQGPQSQCKMLTQEQYQSQIMLTIE